MNFINDLFKIINLCHNHNLPKYDFVLQGEMGTEDTVCIL